MNDCEETDFQGSCVVLGKRKPKKNSRKEHQDQVTLKKDASRKKKKRKGSTCKDTMGRKKEKKKDKKTNKRKICIDSDRDVIITQVSPAQADPTMIYKTPSLCRHQEQEAKPKRKKKVVFDLSPGYIRVKRPQFVSSSGPKKVAAFEKKTMEDMTRLTQDNNSPCNSEDINSQDLFITQKTFRALSPEPSGVSTCTATTSARAPMQQSIKNEKCEPEDPTTCVYGQQHPWKSPMTECFTEEKMRIKKTRCNYKNGENCSQVKVEFQTGLSEYERVDAQPQVSCSPAETNASESWISSQQISASTQTENFFTSELSSYLSFIRKASTRSADLKPLDLSLPPKARKNPWTSATNPLLPGQNKGNRCKNPELGSGCSLKIKELKKDPSVGCMADANPSLCSESGQKSTDTTASSGEEQPRSTKLDLTQVRLQDSRPTPQCVSLYMCTAVQLFTKLAESSNQTFIFTVFRSEQFKHDSTSLFSSRPKETVSLPGQSLR